MTSSPLEPLPDEPVDEDAPVNPRVEPEERRDGDYREPEPGAVPPESTNG